MSEAATIADPAQQLAEACLKVLKLRAVIRDLLDQIDSLDDYKLTRDVEPYKAEACWEDALYRAREAVGR